jgi:hypothetical protein
MVSLFRWQGRDDLASWWRATHGDGEYADDTWSTEHNLARKLEAANVRFAYTVDGDVEFLEWAVSTRRGCGITVLGGIHMVALVHLDDEWAAVLDNNDTQQFIWIPRETLVSEWKHSNGWAATPVYSPAPPLPTEITP